MSIVLEKIRPKWRLKQKNAESLLILSYVDPQSALSTPIFPPKRK